MSKKIILFLIFLWILPLYAQEIQEGEGEEVGIVLSQPPEILKRETQLRISPLPLAKVSIGFPVYRILFLPDNKSLVTGDSQGGLKIWSLPGLKLKNVLAGHTDIVFSLAAKKNLLGSSGKDGIIKIWLLPRGRLIKEIEIEKTTISDLEFSPDGTILASCSFKRLIDLWNVKKDFSYLTSLKGHQGSIYNLSFSPDGTILASCSRDRTTRLWSLKELKEIQVIRGHAHILLDCAISPEGDCLATTGVDGLMNIWKIEVEQEKIAPLFTYPHGTWVTALRFTPQGDYIVTVSRKGQVRIFRRSDFSLMGIFEVFDQQPILSLDISSDGKYLSVSSKTGEVLLYEWEKIKNLLLKEP